MGQDRDVPNLPAPRVLKTDDERLKWDTRVYDIVSYLYDAANASTAVTASTWNPYQVFFGGLSGGFAQSANFAFYDQTVVSARLNNSLSDGTAATQYTAYNSSLKFSALGIASAGFDTDGVLTGGRGYLFTDSAQGFAMVSSYSGTSLYFAAGGTTGQMYLTSDGRLGLGLASPICPVQIYAAPITTDAGTGGYSLLLSDSTAMAAGVGGMIGFSGRYNTGDTTQSLWSSIRGFKESATSGGTGGRLLITTQVDGLANVTALTIDSTQRVWLGPSTVTTSRNLQYLSTESASNYGGAALTTWSSTAAHNSILDFNRSKSSTIGTYTVVASGDALGSIIFRGSNGTAFDEAAYITAHVDGTPGASGDMPGRLAFWTSPDGSSTPVERVRITQAGRLGVGTSAPLCPMQIYGAPIRTVLEGTGGYSLLIADSTAMAIGVGGCIGLSSRYVTDDTTQTLLCSIRGFKVDGTSGNTGGGMILGTQPNGGAITTAITINSSQQVGIGTDTYSITLANTLHVGGTGSFNGFKVETVSDNQLSMSLKKSGREWLIGIDSANSGADDFFIYDNTAAALRFSIGAGVLVGSSPTGGDKGAGTINCSGDVYKNGTAYTNPDYVFEQWATGRIVQFADNEGAAGYERLTLDQMRAYVRTHFSFPRAHDACGMFARADLLLEKLEEAYCHLFELDTRLRALEGE